MKEIKTEHYKQAQKFLKTLKDMPVSGFIPGSPSYGDVAETAIAPQRAVGRAAKRLWELIRNQKDKETAKIEEPLQTKELNKS